MHDDHKMLSGNIDFATYIYNAKKIAKELGYEKDTIDRISNAKSMIQVDNILSDARHKKEREAEDFEEIIVNVVDKKEKNESLHHRINRLINRKYCKK